MTSSRAKDALVGLWVTAFLVAIALRLAGIDPDGGLWKALSATVAVLMVACGVAVVALWMREQRSASRLGRELRPWIVALAAILTIGGAYALLLALL